MTKVLKSQSIIPRLDGIMRDLDELEKISKLPFPEYKKDPHAFPLTQFYLRQALEGVFHIGAHILARLNGGRATEYKDIAKKLGEFNIVDNEFAETKLVNMAGYRNRLTHFYAEISREEIYKILNNNLPDIKIFIKAIKKLLNNPEKFNLEIE
jgi:uncharacterized protein YutE (UPF0331/DUF86 family)